MDFNKARRKRLCGISSEFTSPLDCLDIAKDFVEEEGTSGNVITIIERKEGGISLFFSDIKLETAVYLLEKAKQHLLSE